MSVTTPGLKAKYRTCIIGMTRDEVKDAVGDRLDEFGKWMNGQTMALCQGRVWSYEAHKYVESCGGVAHGGVVYWWDVVRFLNSQEVID